MRMAIYSETEWYNRVSVWEQRQYDVPLPGGQASQGHEQEPSTATHSIWEALHYKITIVTTRISDLQQCCYYLSNALVDLDSSGDVGNRRLDVFFAYSC